MHASTTLITATLDQARLRPPVAAPQPASEPVTGDQRSFSIESADSFFVRQSANALLTQRYGWRGYQTVSLPANQTADRTTLTAIEGGNTIGTITVGLDGPSGMNCEQIFAPEIDALRRRFGRICEFTKLAIDPVAGTNRVLAALFHVAYLVAHRLRGYQAVVMEVNPRHVRFYERLLGGTVFGEARLNTSVNAPAVLLVIDFAHVEQQIDLLAWQGGAAAAQDRSLYPLAFSQREEEGIVARLMEAQPAASKHLN